MRLSCTIYSAITLILFSNIVLYASGTPEKSPIWNQTWTDRLKADLFVKYDKFVRPTEHYNSTVVYFDLSILHIDVDEFKSTVTVNAWTKFEWTDDKLKWDPAKYGNLQNIHVGNHEIWRPDVLLYYSGTAGTVEHYADTSCINFHDGKVLWMPPSQFIGLCDLNLDFWPFDTQICTLTFGSWVYHGEEIDLRLMGTDKEWEQPFIQNTEWVLLNLTKNRKSVTYSFRPEPYSTLQFTMTLKRNSWIYFIYILVIPAFVICFLILSMFWLQPQSEMKIIIAVCTALIITVFLVFFGVKVPGSPLIVAFYSFCLLSIVISLIISITVINMTKKPYYQPLPRNIRRLLNRFDCGTGMPLFPWIEWRRPVQAQELRGKLTEESTIPPLHNSTSNISDNEDRQNIISLTKNTIQLEWIQLGVIVNHFAFMLLFLIFATLAVAYVLLLLE